MPKVTDRPPAEAPTATQRIFAKPLPQILDEMEESIRAASDTFQRTAEQASRETAEASARASNAAREAAETSTMASHMAADRAEDASTVARQAAESASQSATQAVHRAEEAAREAKSTAAEAVTKADLALKKAEETIPARTVLAVIILAILASVMGAVAISVGLSAIAA